MNIRTKTLLAAAALAIAGTVSFVSTEAEARGGRGGGGGFHAGGGFRGGSMGGFRGGFHGHRIHRHGHFHRHVHWPRHPHWHHRHYRFGAVVVGGALASCEWVRRYDPVYGVYRRVQICD